LWVLGYYIKYAAIGGSEGAKDTENTEEGGFWL